MPRRRIIPYDPALQPLARALRKKGTLAEVLLWQQLKGRQMRGYAFYRQRPIDRYIVDFFCPELMLAIEVDGSSHAQKRPEDLARQARLEALGVRFLRFEDRKIKQSMSEVRLLIEQWIEQAETDNR